MGGSKSPWCRGKEGQEHDWVLVAPSRPPFCQPLRAWRRESMEHGDVHLIGDERVLAEDWECFHQEFCQRCRKHGIRAIWRDECPNARPGAVVIADPVL